ncbi:MAG TPA: hypothetical protein VNT03_06145 [Baekduia sp.]|nr:hypothetical protein [Baekduia sp.]
MPRPIDLGRAVLLAGAALLCVSLFTEWYDTGPTGWQVFESLDLVLAALAVAAVVAALRPDAIPPLAAAALPAAALLIVVVQLIDPPPAAGGGDPSTGAWLALAGALFMAAGAALSLAAISVTVQVRERDVRRRVPAVDRRGAADEDADLTADADSAAGARSSPSLFSGLGEGDDVLGDAPPRRPARFTPREAGEAAPAPPGASASSGAVAGGSAADLERTQPLAGLPDTDEEDPERS